MRRETKGARMRYLYIPIWIILLILIALLHYFHDYLLSQMILCFIEGIGIGYTMALLRNNLNR
jgi:hypothetical protein